jgi:hypothetical protein
MKDSCGEKMNIGQIITRFCRFGPCTSYSSSSSAPLYLYCYHAGVICTPPPHTNLCGQISEKTDLKSALEVKSALLCFVEESSTDLSSCLDKFEIGQGFPLTNLKSVKDFLDKFEIGHEISTDFQHISSKNACAKCTFVICRE